MSFCVMLLVMFVGWVVGFSLEHYTEITDPAFYWFGGAVTGLVSFASGAYIEFRKD